MNNISLHKEIIANELCKIDNGWKIRHAENVEIQEMLRQIHNELKRDDETIKISLIKKYIEDIKVVLFEVDELKCQIDEKDEALEKIVDLAQGIEASAQMAFNAGGY